MSSIKQTVAGKWFLNSKNKNRYFIECIPKRVFECLSKMSDKEIRQLANEIAFDYFVNFSDKSVDKKKDNGTDLCVENYKILNKEFNKKYRLLLREYKKQFSSFADHKKNLLSTTINAAFFILKMLVYHYNKILEIDSYANIIDLLYDIIEIEMLDKDKRLVFYKTYKKDDILFEIEDSYQIKNDNLNNIIFEDNLLDVVLRHIKNNNIKSAKKIIQQYKKIIKKLK